MKRRDFIKIGMGGLAAIVADPLLKIPPIFKSEVYAATRTVNLTIGEALVEMVDLSQVYMWLFGTTASGPSFPGPVIFATSGDTIIINVTNTLDEPHAFRIVGTRFETGPISPGQTRTLNFTAPSAGTYLYIDPLNDPVNRVLGLHGVIVVLPQPSATNKTPYSVPTTGVRNLFNDLGRTAEFPGQSWDPARTWIWQFHNIDPRWHELAQAGQVVDPVQLRNEFLPRYFTINGRSGFFASHDHDTAPSGNVGQPALIRMVNTGLATHSPHMHANHFFVLSINNGVQSNVFFVDTFTVAPLDRVDILLPFERPPDTPPVHPNNPQRLLRLDAAEELTLSFGDVPQSPLEYPMHCHMEMSQTAAGGNYPLGLVTHLTFTGDVDGVPFPSSAGLVQGTLERRK